MERSLEKTHVGSKLSVSGFQHWSPPSHWSVIGSEWWICIIPHAFPKGMQEIYEIAKVPVFLFIMLQALGLGAKS